MSKQLTPSEELAAIRKEIEILRSMQSQGWQIACHLIGRCHVFKLHDHGLKIVFKSEYEELVKQAGVKGAAFPTDSA